MVHSRLSRWIGLAIAASALACAAQAGAFTVTAFSPQGQVARVHQVVVKFNEGVVRFGDPHAPAPITLACSGADVKNAQGRWIGPREWVTDFAGDLPPGVRCEAQAVPGFQSATGGTLTGKKAWAFNTGGHSWFLPASRRTVPSVTEYSLWRRK